MPGARRRALERARYPSVIRSLRIIVSRVTYRGVGSILVKPIDSPDNGVRRTWMLTTEGEPMNRKKVMTALATAATVTLLVTSCANQAATPGSTSAAAGGAIVTLGIGPTGPETGFGYLRCTSASAGELTVAEFVEKPDLPTAQRYLAEGGYYWNSGNFVVRASVWLAALRMLATGGLPHVLRWSGPESAGRRRRCATAPLPAEFPPRRWLEALPQPRRHATRAR